MVIEVADEVEVFDDFCWLTLGELKKLLLIDNFVNMDARSVISTIPLIDDDILQQTKDIDWNNINALSNEWNLNSTEFNLSLLYSACSENEFKSLKIRLSPGIPGKRCIMN